MKKFYTLPKMELTVLPQEDVIATSTHFGLRKYKDKGIVYGPEQKDERGNQF